MTAPTPVSPRPYLLRAMHQWIMDGGHTPHLIVDATVEGVEVPEQHVKEGRIVLNISYSAAQGLVLGNEWVEFNARFGGVARSVRVPVRAALGIYSRETGQGMAFTENDLTPQPPTETPPTPERNRRAQLKVVK